MQIKAGRIIIVSIIIEVIAILGLVLIVALFGPNEAQAAQMYAVQTGYWFGPVSGFVLCITGGWYIARPLPSYQIINGLLLGLTVALIDVLLLIASSTEFQSIFVISNLGRLLAGLIGGWLVSRMKGRTAV